MTNRIILTQKGEHIFKQQFEGELKQQSGRESPFLMSQRYKSVSSSTHCTPASLLKSMNFNLHKLKTRTPGPSLEQELRKRDIVLSRLKQDYKQSQKQQSPKTQSIFILPQSTQSNESFLKSRIMEVMSRVPKDLVLTEQAIENTLVRSKSYLEKVKFLHDKNENKHKKILQHIEKVRKERHQELREDEIMAKRPNSVKIDQLHMRTRYLQRLERESKKKYHKSHAAFRLPNVMTYSISQKKVQRHRYSQEGQN